MKKKLIGLLVFVLIASSICQVYANDVQTAKTKLNDVNSELDDLEGKKKNEETLLNQQIEQKEQILEQLEESENVIRLMEEQVQLSRSAVESIDSAIAYAEQDYNEHLRTYQTRLRSMYKSIIGGNYLMFFLESKSFEEVIEKIQMMRQIAKSDKRLTERLKDEQQEILQLKEIKLTELEEAIRTIKNRQQEVDNLEVSRGKLEDSINEQQSKIQMYEDEKDELKQASFELEQQLKILSTGDYVGGNMVWPLPSNRLLNKDNLFGMRFHPVYKEWRMHSGIDIGGNRGDYEVAANAGVVIYTGDRGDGYGNLVIINHGGGITTLYAHIDNKGILVKEGQYVKAGQAIAKVGQTGLATCNHLHFEVRKNGKPVNPLDYIPAPKGYF